MKTFALAGLLAITATFAMAEGVNHKVAVHVDENDPQVMNMALNNVGNLISYYAEQGDTVTVEVVTYGPGLMMLVEGESPVADRIAAMTLANDGLTFAACANTLAGMEKKAGHDIPLMSEATVVPSGVVQLITLQEDGYAYVRP
ncbi:MAG: DsrE family protein [Alphaproteobacteria bacterium]|jgi:intracellular sulfur oxidation DsrE/DsrF family protein|uniref:Uncharacterized protein n=1 Tax=Loktanella salsilacus TaxID=195913 RepID=A0A1I4G572_9RHOB|nr:DsrE family protein [Loktanella salsilacus]MBU0860355.1 DsrE family protein [Alphaproteobacteria bacterium]MBU1834839.1 DsrE family protein [Alphaproteobacteria bacterium]SFL24823.1 hypothetical protein SAMN04488004_11195 [Loktanella salsilacus]